HCEYTPSHLRWERLQTSCVTLPISSSAGLARPLAGLASRSGRLPSVGLAARYLRSHPAVALELPRPSCRYPERGADHPCPNCPRASEVRNRAFLRIGFAFLASR